MQSVNEIKHQIYMHDRCSDIDRPNGFKQHISPNVPSRTGFVFDLRKHALSKGSEQSKAKPKSISTACKSKGAMQEGATGGLGRCTTNPAVALLAANQHCQHRPQAWHEKEWPSSSASSISTEFACDILSVWRALCLHT